MLMNVLTQSAPFDFEQLLAQLAAQYGPLLLALLGLSATDVLLGIGSALKRGVFEWAKVANFYRTNILPKLVGWAALTILTYTISAASLPPEAAGVLSPITAGLAYAAVVADLAGSIVANFRELFGTAPGKIGGE